MISGRLGVCRGAGGHMEPSLIFLWEWGGGEGVGSIRHGLPGPAKRGKSIIGNVFPFVGKVLPWDSSGWACNGPIIFSYLPPWFGYHKNYPTNISCFLHLANLPFKTKQPTNQPKKYLLGCTQKPTKGFAHLPAGCRNFCIFLDAKLLERFRSRKRRETEMRHWTVVCDAIESS